MLTTFFNFFSPQNPTVVVSPTVYLPSDLASHINAIGLSAFNELKKTSEGSNRHFRNCRKREEPYDDFPCKLHMFITKQEDSQEVTVYVSFASSSKNPKEGSCKTCSKAFRLVFTIEEKTKCILASVTDAARIKNKILPENDLLSRYAIEAVNRETSVLSEFRGISSICQLLDATGVYTGRHNGQSAKKAAMYQSYYPTELLDAINSKKFISFNQAALDILWALIHLHRANKVHRDLKPENTLFDEKERVKLIDFEHSRDANPQATWGISGTDPYLSPEQVRQAYLFKAGSTLLAYNDYKDDKSLMCLCPTDIWTVGYILLLIRYSRLPVWAGLVTLMCRNLILAGRIAQLDCVPASVKNVTSSQTQLIKRLSELLAGPDLKNPLEFADEQLEETIENTEKALDTFQDEITSGRNTVFLNSSAIKSAFPQFSEGFKRLLEKFWKKLETEPLQSNDPDLQFIAKFLHPDPERRITAQDAYDELKARLLNKKSSIRFPDEMQ